MEKNKELPYVGIIRYTVYYAEKYVDYVENALDYVEIETIIITLIIVPF